MSHEPECANYGEDTLAWPCVCDIARSAYERGCEDKAAEVKALLFAVSEVLRVVEPLLVGLTCNCGDALDMHDRNSAKRPCVFAAKCGCSGYVAAARGDGERA